MKKTGGQWYLILFCVNILNIQKNEITPPVYSLINSWDCTLQISNCIPFFNMSSYILFDVVKYKLHVFT